MLYTQNHSLIYTKPKEYESVTRATMKWWNLKGGVFCAKYVDLVGRGRFMGFWESIKEGTQNQNMGFWESIKEEPQSQNKTQIHEDYESHWKPGSRYVPNLWIRSEGVILFRNWEKFFENSILRGFGAKLFGI